MVLKGFVYKAFGCRHRKETLANVGSILQKKNSREGVDGDLFEI
jgi:hypothetical protein